jgi:Cu/Ag efflux pump CusA
MIRALLSGAMRFRMLLVGAAAGMIVLGANSLQQMPGDVVPELGSGPVLEVQTEALGLSSKEVEQYVTVPLENNLLDGIMGVWDMRSNSVPGVSSIDLSFEPGTTLLHARQLVQERLTNAFSLPNVSKPPLLIQPLSTSSRVMMIGLSSSALSGIELSYLARWIIKPRLSGVPGVANVAIFGQQDRQLQVLVDPSALAAHRITLQQIINTAGNSQLVSPLSYLEGAAPGTGGFLDGPNQRLEIRPLLPLGTPRDLAAVPIAGAPARQPLGGMTTVVQDHQPLIGDGFVRGRPGLVLMIQKLPSASVLGVTRGVQRALDELRPALPAVTIDSSFFRPASYVSDGLHNLALAVAIGAVLGLLALIALFGAARAAVIALVSATVSLLSALLLLDALGYTLTPLVVLGLLVATVVVVDDGVGAAHEIARRVRERHAGTNRDGDADADSSSIGAVVIDACAQLRSPLAYATLIVLLSVAPVFFSQGLAATFVHPMMLSFTFAVIVSMVVALTLTPALAMLLFDRGRPLPRHAPSLRRVKSAYAGLLDRSLRTPSPVLLGVCVIGLAAVAVLPFLGEPSAPSFRDRNLIVQWNGPAGTSLPEMDRITGRVLEVLRRIPAVGDVGATLGRAVSADEIVDTSSGQIYVAIKPGADYEHARAAVQQAVGSVPGMQASVGTYEQGVMAGVLAPADHRVDVRVYGEDYAVLGTLAHRVGAIMSHVNGLGPARIQLPTQEPNIEVAINDAAALRAGVLPGDARREASTLISGLAVGNFFEDQAVFDVVVRGRPAVAGSLSSVRNLLIDSSRGGHARLRDIAQVSVRPDPVDIRREAVSRYVDISAEVQRGSVSPASGQVRRGLATLTFPLEYHAEIQGGTPDDPTSHTVFISYVLAAAIGILLLLQAAVASWRLALLLFLVIPVALSGGLLVALGGSDTGSLAACAGLLGVLAFSARQGLLLVEHTRRRQAADGGSLRREIVARAAAERFEPALAAAIVTAAILLPFVVVGDVAGNELTHTAAAVMLGGLVSTTLLNLLILPAVQLTLGPVDPIAVPEADDVPSWAAAESPPMVLR